MKTTGLFMQMTSDPIWQRVTFRIVSNYVPPLSFAKLRLLPERITQKPG